MHMMYASDIFKGNLGIALNNFSIQVVQFQNTCYKVQGISQDPLDHYYVRLYSFQLMFKLDSNNAIEM